VLFKPGSPSPRRPRALAAAASRSVATAVGAMRIATSSWAAGLVG